MSLREILIWPHPTLGKTSSEVVEITDKIRSLVQDLVETCDHVGGLGLAAVQVGEPVAVFVIDRARVNIGEGYEVFVNPKLTYVSDETSLLGEGCLSMPGVDEVIRRSNRVHLTYTDLDEESHTIVADGVLSQALQHEMDHLNGQVIAQRLPSFRRSTLRKRMESLTEKMRKLGVSYMDVVEGRRPS